MSTSIVLADDHLVVREGLRAILEANPEYEVVAEAADGLETVQVVESLRPDILVLDLMMPNLPGLEVIRQVAKRSSTTRVVVVSMHADEAYVLQALRNGAFGYVIKTSGADELTKAITRAASSLHYLSPPLSERAIEIYLQRVIADDLDPYDTLSGREREVLHLPASGHTNARIAESLSLSDRTVESHCRNIMKKLKVDSRVGMVRYALLRELSPGSQHEPVLEPTPET